MDKELIKNLLLDKTCENCDNWTCPREKIELKTCVLWKKCESNMSEFEKHFMKKIRSNE